MNFFRTVCITIFALLGGAVVAAAGLVLAEWFSAHYPLATHVVVFLFRGFLLAYALWMVYLAVMNLARAKRAGTLSKPALWFGTPVLFLGYLLDFLTNVLVCTVVFLDLPRETTVTARLKRYASGPAGWRLAITRWLADAMLDDFDPSGKHI